MQIDLNSDLGENTPGRIVSDDTAMLRVVSSANVSCGFHAGDPVGIRATLASAAAAGVAVGAHPGYDDLAGFGRRELDVEPAVLQAQIEYQLGALQALAGAVGTRATYVKPHGALYNRMARDADTARVVAAAVRAVDPSLVMLCLAGSVGADVVRGSGLTTVAEAFADRGYDANGALLPRDAPGAVLHDPTTVAARILRLATEGVLEAADGTHIMIDAQSVCVHGDSPGAVAMATTVRDVLTAAGVRIAPFAPFAPA